MGHPNENVLRSYLDALGRGDDELVREALADDVRLHVPGRNPLSGEYRGVDDFLSFFERLGDVVSGIEVEIHDVLASDEHVVVLVRRQLERQGDSGQFRAVSVYHTESGKIAEVWDHEMDQYALDEFLS